MPHSFRPPVSLDLRVSQRTSARAIPHRTSAPRLPIRLPSLVALAVLVAAPGQAAGQSEGGQSSISDLRVPRFDLPSPATALYGPPRGGEYLGVVGPHAAWLGFETGEGEVWVHPMKVAREVSLAFKIPEYPEPIPGAQVARGVESRPGHVTVTYSHGAFVVKEHILAPRDLPGILILLEADAVVELEIQVEFQPVLQYAWPGAFGGQYLFWDPAQRGFVLSESLRERNAIIGSPWATEGSAHPAHRLADAPSVFVIPVDPERTREEFIPIAVAGGIAPRDQVLATYREILQNARAISRGIAAWGTTLTDHALSLEGPTPGTLALEWAKVNLAEQRVCNPDLGCGLVAGWGPSGTSFRPGFGWYFGGDAAINSLAMDATGQWEEVAEGLRFLARYQREDGKIPHEISQAAGRIPWFQDFPYAYYHADTTPFWMLALWQYWRASGDEALLRELWPTFSKAYRWCLTVETDGDGIIENTTGGLGAIEVGGLGEGLHQDIYLAAVWIASLEGAGEMAASLGEQSLAEEATALFHKARSSLNREYWRPQQGYHAFGILQGGGTNDNLTAWPGTALSFGLLDAPEAEGTLRALAGDAITASWGARLLSTESELFDPLHYNNGAVWPFMTGFVALGQYRYRRPWAGYPLLYALWRLNGDWSLGRHPENLSGAFYQTMDATVPHQFFASSMLVTPLARGLLGWEPDAPRRRARLAPQPPPQWEDFAVQNLRVGQSTLSLEYHRERGSAEIRLRASGPPVDLTWIQSLPLGAHDVVMEGNLEGGRGRQSEGLHDLQHELTFTLSEGADPVFLRFRWAGGLEVVPPFSESLPPGSPSGGPRILDFTRDGEGWALTLEGEGGRKAEVLLRGERVTSDVGTVTPAPEWDGEGQRLTVELPSDGPRVVRTVHLRQVR